MKSLTLSELIKRLQSFEKEFGNDPVCLVVCDDSDDNNYRGSVFGAANATRNPPVNFNKRGIAIWSDAKK